MAGAQARARTRAPWKTLILAAVLLVASTPGGGPFPARASSEPPSGQVAGAAADAPAGAPNILFIFLDDMREDGVMNVPEVLPKTKRWLAAGGTTFTQGFVTTSLCCPERATVWSGRVSHNNGVFDNYTGDNLDHDC